MTFEPPRDKTNKMAASPVKTQISLGIPRTQAFFMRTAKTQDDLSHRWAHMPFCWFCHEAAHFITGFLLIDSISMFRLNRPRTLYIFRYCVKRASFISHYDKKKKNQNNVFCAVVLTYTYLITKFKKAITK